MAEHAPLYSSAVILPILAFPSWILCILPMVWHFSQRNIAAGSLILWLSTLNFFNSINPLIWPRDNINEWWDGSGLCDIQARVQVGAVVALGTCTAMIVRRLANVMDTSNITVVPSKRSVIIERTLEILWCWVFPAFMMIIYYIVQPFRYYIWGISGCVAAYDSSWPSLILIWMWGCITTLFAAFYAGVLIVRLYLYRREFHRLIAARTTTKSRFMRLFIMAITIIVLLIPYSFFIIYQLSTAIVDEYSWNRVHGPDWGTVVMLPADGNVRFDRWGEVGAGYLGFVLFGTGTDANNTYKRLLCSIGLGKIFPNLYIMHESRVSSPSDVTFGKRWTSSWSGKAKSLFSMNGSVTETTRTGSVVLGTPITDHSGTLHQISTNEPILPTRGTKSGTNSKSFFRRFFGRTALPLQFLPAHNTDIAAQHKSPTESVPSGVYARAWASENVGTEHTSRSGGVYIVHEVRQDLRDKTKGKEDDNHIWV